MSEHLGLVTVLYNCEGVLQEFFDTLNFQTYKNFELIIIDNKSKDKSLEVCKNLSKKAEFPCYFIENDNNLGVAAGNNQGIKLALEHKCDKVLLTNNDIVLKKDTIKNLYDKHVENKADLSVPKIYYAGTNKIWCAGGKFHTIKGHEEHFGIYQIDNGQFQKVKRITYSPTCFMLINSNVFSEVGFMDEKYFVYWDDTDFVYRAVFDHKLCLIYVPLSTLQHKVSSSTGTTSDFTVKQVFKNRIYFAKKHNKLPLLYYGINLIYHYTIRYIKLRNNKEKWILIGQALKDGWKM